MAFLTQRTPASRIIAPIARVVQWVACRTRVKSIDQSFSQSISSKQARWDASILHAQANKDCGVLTADLDGSLQFQENGLLHENVPRLDAKHLDLPLKQLYLLAWARPCVKTGRESRAPKEYDVFRIGKFGEGTPRQRGFRFQSLKFSGISPRERIFQMPPPPCTAHRERERDKREPWTRRNLGQGHRLP